MHGWGDSLFPDLVIAWGWEGLRWVGGGEGGVSADGCVVWRGPDLFLGMVNGVRWMLNFEAGCGNSLT